MTKETNTPAQADAPLPPDDPVESGRTILINWILVILGCGALGVAGAIIPELM